MKPPTKRARTPKPPNEELTAALRADWKVIGAYVEIRALQNPGMNVAVFAKMVRAEIVDGRHYDDPATIAAGALGR